MTAKAPRRVLPEPDPERWGAATELAARARAPAVCGNVAFGTAGWTDKTLVQGGLFYPKGAQSAEARLRFYSSQFSLVEVDATYYSLLPPETAQRWLAFTPESFVFDVKAHPIVTGHPVDVARLPGDLARALEGRGARVYPDRIPGEIAAEIEGRFRALVEPLHRAGRLGCVMVQFPPWFAATRGNAKKLERLRERWPDVPISIEVRNKSWLLPERRERVLDLMRSLGFSYVGVDEPDVDAGGVPPVTAVTNPALALVRFHGQSRAGWTKKGASVHERFDYLYAPAELEAWVAPVRALAERAAKVHAIFNNCVRNYAVLGAKGLSVLLDRS
ncbi:MAG: DUF72 domain-containing protein [Myxococcales bacterium]|nr:DUF72 domain-containing protein [Myxococcales bacterium]